MKIREGDIVKHALNGALGCGRVKIQELYFGLEIAQVEFHEADPNRFLQNRRWFALDELMSVSEEEAILWKLRLPNFK